MQFFTLILCLLLSLSGFAQVIPEVSYGRGKTGTEQTIKINWSAEAELKWRNNNEDRLDIMALMINIHSDNLRTTLQETKFTFESTQFNQAEILIELQELVPGELLQLRNKISNEVIWQLESSAKQVLLPILDLPSTHLVWSSPDESYRSRFVIKTIYVHPLPLRNDRAIGFGTALACHPNVACKQDSMFALISGSAVRIRMVMDEGIGWCTGSFINTTRNDKTPYILLAYHCTFDFTPQYDLWRFDLEYRSDSCANPATEPGIFSLTGCEYKAGGQASDFLLVLLNDVVPSNHQVTFAGWNRDENITPDTSYLIHHPNADIRKISTTTNKAIIHPTQIGWSEGYITPPNHHFRFKFTEGGHQAGSSGGPVFNQDGFLIGQLHGGSLGCDVMSIAYTGRLSKSWSLGNTPPERLKDWLDPDNTGTIQLPAITNIASGELADIHGIIQDPLGRPVSNVSVYISGSTTDTLVTNAAGQFELNAVNRNGDYIITPYKNTNQTNGVNVLDLLSIQKHLLGKDTFNFSWQLIAADATNNGDASVGDLLLLLRLMLGKISFFPSSASWRFDPPQAVISSIPAGEPAQVIIRAIKIGDVNGTADPTQ